MVAEPVIIESHSDEFTIGIHFYTTLVGKSRERETYDNNADQPARKARRSPSRHLL